MARKDKENSYYANPDGFYSKADDYQKLDFEELYGIAGGAGYMDLSREGQKYYCSICGYVYDPAEHNGVAFETLSDDWKCPRCKQYKEKFNKA